MRRLAILGFLAVAGCANDYGAICDEKIACTAASDRDTCVDELIALEQQANERGGDCPGAYQDMIDCYGREDAACTGASVWPACATAEGRYEDACTDP